MDASTSRSLDGIFEATIQLIRSHAVGGFVCSGLGPEYFFFKFENVGQTSQSGDTCGGPVFALEVLVLALTESGGADCAKFGEFDFELCGGGHFVFFSSSKYDQSNASVGSMNAPGFARSLCKSSAASRVFLVPIKISPTQTSNVPDFVSMMVAFIRRVPFSLQNTKPGGLGGMVRRYFPAANLQDVHAEIAAVFARTGRFDSVAAKPKIEIIFFNGQRARLKCGLTKVSPMSPGRTFEFWWTRWDSNPRPPHCERGKI